MSDILTASNHKHTGDRFPRSLQHRLQRYWRDLELALHKADLSLGLDSRQQEQLNRAWASSDFVANTCIQRPGLLCELVASGDLSRPYQQGELGRRSAAVFSKVMDEQSLRRVLRQWRLRESLRIAWRDLSGLADLDEVLALMTELADVSVQLTLDHCYRWLGQKNGLPMGEASGRPVHFIVVGLGKLGGRELNFSSDIDLMFAYAEEGATDARRPISNHEFFTKLGRQLISNLEDFTEDGFVFRVDMRLRPNGRSGPLALSFDAVEHYYQTHGRDWERYALLKARVVAGNSHTGEQLLERLRPFVYRKYLDFGAIEAIRDMKQMIARELGRKSISNNIKLGQGGIREIEFIVQSLQLIRGGREPDLQTNRLFEALNSLADSGVLDPQIADELEIAYRFLRNVEHRLQMVAEQQTHLLPKSPDAQQRLAVAAGFEQWTQFETHILSTMSTVHGHFSQVFATDADKLSDATLHAKDIWLGILDESATGRGLAKAGYADADAALQRLRTFRHSHTYQIHSKYGRERLDRLMPLLIAQAADTEDPNQTLHRLMQLVESIGRRSAYLMLLVENPLALTELVKLSAASAWITNWISQHPLLLDELLQPISSSPLISPGEIRTEIEQRLASIEADDLETQMEVLREVHHAQILKVAAADVLDYLSSKEVARHLCAIAELLLQYVVNVAEASQRNKFGSPSAIKEEQHPEFGIVAYGKLGSLELGYHSDLDLVFIHDGAVPQGSTQGGRRSISNQQYYGRLGQRIVHILTTRTATGVLYEIDTRLRPSGRAGPLVTSMSAYAAYQRKRAWTWEHQALVRARMISGGDRLQQRFETIRHQVLTQYRDPDTLRRDIREMREKMVAAHDQSDQQVFDLKQGKGGIVDIEFIVQYYVLRWAHGFPDLARPRSSLGILDELQTAGLLHDAHHRLLTDAYNRYLTAELRLKLTEKPSLVGVSELTELRREVADLWHKIFEAQPQ